MFLKISRAVLKDAITKTKYALPKKPLNPVLSHFVFEVTKNNLVIKTTDGTLSCFWKGAVESDKAFSFTIDNALIKGILTSLKDEYVTIEWQDDSKNSDAFKLTCGRYELIFSSGNLRDYPKIDLPNDESMIALPNNFSDILESVYFSIGNPKIQTNYKGLCLEVNRQTGILEVTGTDNFRLSHASCVIETASSFKIVVPKEAVSEVIKLSPNYMYYDQVQNKIHFKLATEATIFLTAITRNLAFPNVYKFVDSSYEGEPLCLKTSDFLDMLKRLRHSSDKDDKKINIQISNNNLVACTSSFKVKAKESIPISAIGEYKFTLNIDFIIEYFSKAKEDEVTFKIVNNDFILFEKPSYRHILSVTA